MMIKRFLSVERSNKSKKLCLQLLKIQTLIDPNHPRSKKDKFAYPFLKGLKLSSKKNIAKKKIDDFMQERSKNYNKSTIQRDIHNT